MDRSKQASAELRINGRVIGSDQPPYVVAELSANHNGSLERALKLIEVARDAGADALKLQTYTADTMTLDSKLDDFRIEEGPWAGETLYRLYQRASTPWEWHPVLFDRAQSLGLTVFSTPFDETAVDFLESLGTPAYKVASFEIIDLPLIRRVAATGKPVILSTGMATLSEVESAVGAARAAGCRELAVLKCVSAYPADPANYHLRTIPDLAERFHVPVGLSDHTIGSATAVAAVALGASIIEKHYTLDRSGGGPDDAFSATPEDLAELCRGVRDAWRALGRVNYERSAAEQQNLRFRRSLYFVRDLAAGELITRDDVRSIRPGFGLVPDQIHAVIGRRTARRIRAGSPVTIADLAADAT